MKHQLFVFSNYECLTYINLCRCEEENKQTFNNFVLYDETEFKSEICDSHARYFGKPPSNEHERFPDRKQSCSLFFLSLFVRQ